MSMRWLFLLVVFTTTIDCREIKKSWTILTYIAADNDLNKFAEQNIQQMMKVGSNSDCNILIYLAETKNGQKYGKLLYVDKNNLVEIFCEYHADSGSRQTCLNSCIKAFTEYQADHYALIFWDHGSGCLNMPFADLFKGIAYDQPLDTYLTDIDLLAILKEVSTMLGKKIDILAFDACLMAGIELQALCTPYVDYYVASEELESSPGWNYAKAFGIINQHTNPKQAAQAWVSAYDQTYASISDRYTLSALELADIHLLAENIDSVAKNLIRLLHSDHNQAITAMLQKSTNPNSITCFDNPDKPDYIDLDHVYANILEHLTSLSINDEMQQIKHETIQLLTQGRALINKIVIANVAGKYHARARGISIYWAQETIHPSYATLLWTTAYPYWQQLLQKIRYVNV